MRSERDNDGEMDDSPPEGPDPYTEEPQLPPHPMPQQILPIRQQTQQGHMDSYDSLDLDAVDLATSLSQTGIKLSGDSSSPSRNFLFDGGQEMAPNGESTGQTSPRAAKIPQHNPRIAAGFDFRPTYQPAHWPAHTIILHPAIEDDIARFWNAAPGCPRTTIWLGGRLLDITNSGLDPDFLNALSFSHREDAIKAEAEHLRNLADSKESTLEELRDIGLTRTPFLPPIESPFTPRPVEQFAESPTTPRLRGIWNDVVRSAPFPPCVAVNDPESNVSQTPVLEARRPVPPGSQPGRKRGLSPGDDDRSSVVWHERLQNKRERYQIRDVLPPEFKASLAARDYQGPEIPPGPNSAPEKAEFDLQLARLAGERRRKRQILEKPMRRPLEEGEIIKVKKPALNIRVRRRLFMAAKERAYEDAQLWTMYCRNPINITGQGLDINLINELPDDTRDVYLQKEALFTETDTRSVDDSSSDDDDSKTADSWTDVDDDDTWLDDDDDDDDDSYSWVDDDSSDDDVEEDKPTPIEPALASTKHPQMRTTYRGEPFDVKLLGLELKTLNELPEEVRDKQIDMAFNRAGENRPGPTRPRMTKYQGRPFDVSDLGLDPETLDELPDYIRDEQILRATMEHRTTTLRPQITTYRGDSFDVSGLDLDAKTLNELPAYIRDEQISKAVAGHCATSLRAMAPPAATQSMWTTYRGARFDITGLGLDPETLSELPSEIRDEQIDIAIEDGLSSNEVAVSAPESSRSAATRPAMPQSPFRSADAQAQIQRSQPSPPGSSQPAPTRPVMTSSQVEPSNTASLGNQFVPVNPMSRAARDDRMAVAFRHEFSDGADRHRRDTLDRRARCARRQAQRSRRPPRAPESSRPPPTRELIFQPPVVVTSQGEPSNAAALNQARRDYRDLRQPDQQ